MNNIFFLIVTLLLFSCNSENRKLIITFDNANGLSEGNPVTINDFKIGHVSKISLNAKYKINAEIELNDTIRLPKDSKFMIGSNDLLTKAIIVTPGKSKHYLSLHDKIIGSKQKEIGLEKLMQLINDKTNLEIFKTISDSSKFTIIEYNDESKWVFDNKCRKTELTKDNLNSITTLLNREVLKYNAEAEKRSENLRNDNRKDQIDRNNYVIELENYKRQYIPVVNDKNEKIVWVNCFYGDWTENRKTNIVVVCDGGNRYFNLKINLTTKKCYDFRVNGEA